MNIKTDFENIADETYRLWKLKERQYHKAMNRSYLVRLFYAIRWKYMSNEIYRGVVMALVVYGPLGGFALAMLIFYLLFNT